jgi:hypothetical protein
MAPRANARTLPGDGLTGTPLRIPSQGKPRRAEQPDALRALLPVEKAQHLHEDDTD